MLIELSHLKRQYDGVGGVTDVSMSVPNGSVYALCGANGSGKTTTLSVLAGLFYGEAGRLTLNGRTIPLDRWARRPGLGFVADVPVLDEALTPWQWLAFVASLKGAAPAADAGRQAETLMLPRDALNQPIYTLSGGTRRKVAIWTEFVTASAAIIFDEPLVGLDPRAIQGFHDLTRRYVAADRSIILSTHLLHEAEAIATHVGILADGVTRREGALSEIRGETTLFTAFLEVTADAERD
jgi:ABC-2 type transport system ATP-binding protein